MLSPVETGCGGTLLAFLFCAVTPIRLAHYGAFQTDAKRYSFSLSRALAIDPSRLWRGLEQTAFG